MVNVRLAKKVDMEIIYHLWHKVNKSVARIFGLEESIEANEVYVFIKDDKVSGFVRFNLRSNKTNDYIKINEIFIDENNVELGSMDISEIDRLLNLQIIKLGYLSAEVKIPLEDLHQFRLDYGWVVVGIKTSFFKNNPNSYNNYIVRKEVDMGLNGINDPIIYLEQFGEDL